MFRRLPGWCLIREEIPLGNQHEHGYTPSLQIGEVPSRMASAFAMREGEIAMSGRTRDSGPAVRRSVLLVAATLAVLTVAGAASRAAEIETRDFMVQVSGKPAGEVHMTIHKQDNGAVQVRCDTDIKVSLLIGTYKYVYRGLEVWKDQRLVRFESNTDDNGTRYIVSAFAEPAGLRIKVNNAERVVKQEVWLTSYWCLPDPKLRSNTIPLIDADTGKDLSGNLRFVANEKRRVAGQETTLNHYKLTGKVNVDLWYDGSERLVRQEWMEQGHKTVVELMRVRR
jgi:hypothetical protein